VRPIRLDHWTFDNNVIHLSIVISSLPLVFEFGTGSARDGVDSSVGWEIVVELRRFWEVPLWLLVWFGFWLLDLGVLLWVSDLWQWWWVGYLQRWLLMWEHAWLWMSSWFWIVRSVELGRRLRPSGGVIDLLVRWIGRSLNGCLTHILFCFPENWAIFGVVVCFFLVIHTVKWSARASTFATSSSLTTSSPVILIPSTVEALFVSLRQSEISIIFLPVFRRATPVGVDAVYCSLLGTRGSVVLKLSWSRSFGFFRCLPLLLELAKVQDL